MRWTLRLLAPLLLLVTAAEVHAQFGAVGIKGGVNWTDLSGDSQTSSGNGFIGGVYASGQSALIVAQIEVLLTKRSFLEPDVSGAFRVDESLIQVPLLFGARGGTGPLLAMPYVGPSVAFKSSCKVRQAPTDRNCGDVPGFEEKSTLWSLLFGLALDYRVDRVLITVDGRYDLGLSDVFVNRAGKWRSFAIMFGIGYLMPT